MYKSLDLVCVVKHMYDTISLFHHTGLCFKYSTFIAFIVNFASYNTNICELENRESKLNNVLVYCLVHLIYFKPF